MPIPKKVLLVYSHGQGAMRPTTAEHLGAFRAYCPYPTRYLNLAHEAVPTADELAGYDLVVFHYLFLTHHWGGRDAFRALMRRAGRLRRAPAVKAMLAQDEFYHADLFCEFIRHFGIGCVFSVVPETEWDKVYRGIDRRATRILPSLTGYVDEAKIGLVRELTEASPQRTIDIGYRTAGEPYFWFGRHGYLKQRIAEVFEERAPAVGLRVDISTRRDDMIVGDDWYRFLLRCKYTIGVESGTSILDWDGSLQRRTQRYVAGHPGAGFEEVEAACFPGRDGEAELVAASPRHLEAALTRTCQVLTAGQYNGIMRPEIHYIPLKKDLSDVDAALRRMADDAGRQAMVERAYADIVASGRYSYRRFVEYVVEQSLACGTRAVRPAPFFTVRSALWTVRAGAKRAARRCLRRKAG